MASSDPKAAEAKELSLVGKVEMRIALADSDKKLEDLLKTYLAPLLLKLGSESVAVRNKVISICQHVNTRIKPQELRLPVATLLKQFKEHADVPLIRHFDMLYVQQGITRLPVSERLELLPVLLRGIATDFSKSALHASQLFHLLLRLLGHFKLPPRGSKEDEALRSSLGLAEDDAGFLSQWFGKLLLLSVVRKGDSEVSQPGLSPEDYKFLTMQGKPDAWDPTEGGLNLAETKVLVSRFLASGMFTDEERFLPALFASADSNSRISEVGDDVLKRVLPTRDLEDREVIHALLEIYFGSAKTGGSPAVRVPLKIRILNLLSKSRASSTFPKQMSQIVEEGLLPDQSDQQGRTAGREVSKFRSAIFSLVNFVARHGKTTDLSIVAQTLVGNFRTFIEDQGWPVPDQGQDFELRGYGYETIGLLARAAPEKLLLEPNLSLLEWLFRSLREDSSGKDVAVSIEEALSTVLEPFARSTASEEVLAKFRSLLLRYARVDPQDGTEGKRVMRSTRYAATRFANRCLPYHDVFARWIDILAVSGDKNERHEVVEEGKKGLDPHWYKMLNTGPGQPLESVPANEPDRFAFPKFDALVNFIFSRQQDEDDMDIDYNLTNSKQILGRVRIFRRDFSNSYSTVIQYCSRVLIYTALKESKIPVDIAAEWERKLETLVSTDERARQAIRAHATDPGQIVPVATILRAAFEQLVQEDAGDIGDVGDLFIDLCSLSPEDIWSQGRLTQDFRALEVPIFSNTIATRTTACHAYGMIASHGDCDSSSVKGSVSVLISKVKQWEGAVGAEVNKVSGACLALSYYFSRLKRREALTDNASEHLSELLQVLFSILKSSNDTTVKEAVYLSIGQLSLFYVIDTAMVDRYMPFTDVINKIYETGRAGKTGNTRAIIALGQVGMIARESEEESSGSNLKHVEEKLYELHEVRQPEVQFSVGEALTCFACGWDSKALIPALDIEGPSDAKGRDMPPTGPTRGTTLLRVLDKSLSGCRNTKPALKKASAIWLLCLLQYCGHRPEMQSRLRDCQNAFKLCLSDRDEVVQEAASRGLGLVYEKGDRSLKDELVRDLVGSFSDNRSKMAGSVTEDTQLFEPGALPTGDGSITTYKDILSLAAEVGDSSLVYRFMSLAANNSIWSSRAAFGRFGLSNIFSDSSVDGYLAENPKLYPKLYRYRFDPNPNVQRSMNDIWNALVKDSSTTIEKNFDAIMNDLLSSILTKEWRVREATCAAIADLVQGRTMDKYEKYLGEIWDKCFKVLDDIKESVRVAAASLARVLTGILTRSLEAGDSSMKNASAMLERVLPFLLSTSGLESSAEEVRVFALSTLLDIIKKSNAKTLRPHIPELVERLLGLLSILEPEAVNYIHLNASKYNLTEQKIDDMRLQSVRSSPLTESIERCLDLMDADTMKALAPRIEAAMKNAVGLPSKVGCSRILVTLSTRHSFLFKPYADNFLKTIEKYIHDRNDTVSSSYGASAGYVARLASDKQLLNAISFCRKLYFDSENEKSRLAAGDIILSISKHAADRFTNLAATILPFVFFAKHDSHEQVKKLFADTWADNVGGSRAVLLYLKEIVTLSDKYLDSPKWDLKHAAARTVADAIVSISSGSEDMSKANAEIVWPALDKAMSGKTWDGKEVVLEAFVKFVERGRALWGPEKKVSGQIEKVAVREAKRVNKSYRPFALSALGKVVKARTDLEVSGVVREIVGDVVEEVVGEEEGEDKMDVDEGHGKKDSALIERTLSSSIEALLSSINPTLLEGTDLTTSLAQALSLAAQATSTHARDVYLTSFDAIKSLFDRLASVPDLKIEDAKVKESLKKLLFDASFEGLSEAGRLKRAQALLAVGKTEGLEFREEVGVEIGKEKSVVVRRELQKVGKREA